MRHYFTTCLFLLAISVWADPIDSLENALGKAEGIQRVKVLNELFKAYNNSDPLKAVGFAREAYNLGKSIDDKKGTAAALNNLGVSYRNQGALDMAVEYYTRALTLYTEIENPEGIATTKNNLGNVYSIKGDYTQALKYFEDSYNALVVLGANDKLAGSMNNLGTLYNDLQLYDKALDYFENAYQTAKKNGAEYPDPLVNIGALFVHKGNYQRAVEYYNRALKIVSESNDKHSQLSILTALGQTFEKANQPAVALTYLDNAAKLATELQTDFYMPQILRSKAASLARQGKMKEAYQTMLTYDEVREKVYGEESSRRIAQNSVALELRSKEAEIDALRRDDELKTLKLRNTEFIITAVVLGVILIFAIANVLMMGRRMRNSAKS